MLAVVNWKKAYKDLRTKYYQIADDKKVLRKKAKGQSRIITELQAENKILKSKAEGQDGPTAELQGIITELQGTITELQGTITELQAENKILKSKAEGQDGPTAELQGIITELQAEAGILNNNAEGQDGTATELQSTITKLLSAVDDIKNRFAAYRNCNTPPSQIRDAPKNSNSKNNKNENSKNNKNKNNKNKNLRSPSQKDGAPKRQQGAQEGHEGKTHKAKPTATKNHTPNKCTGCGSTRLTIVKSITRCITDLKHIVEVITTKHTVNTCRCDSCGIMVEPETDLPKKGEYSGNIVAEVASQYVDRIPIRRISRNMSRYVKMSTGTTWAILCRLGLNLGIPAWKIMEIIRNATILHIDETSIRLNGKTIWIWIFFDPMTGATFYAIRPQ